MEISRQGGTSVLEEIGLSLAMFAKACQDLALDVESPRFSVKIAPKPSSIFSAFCQNHFHVRSGQSKCSRNFDFNLDDQILARSGSYQSPYCP